jgi:hypothetical protein
VLVVHGVYQCRFESQMAREKTSSKGPTAKSVTRVLRGTRERLRVGARNLECSE